MIRLKSFLKNTLKFAIPLLLGVTIFGSVYGKLDIESVSYIILNEIDYKWIILSMFIGFMSHVSRAYRWRLQLRALGANPSRRTICNAIFGTYAVNLLLPRLGEVWRSGYVAKRTKLPFSQILGSVLADRISDTIAMIIITSGVLIFQLPLFLRFLGNYPDIEQRTLQIVTSPWGYILFIAIILAGYFIQRKKGEDTFIGRINLIFKNLWHGFKIVIQMPHRGEFILYTIAIWGCYFLQFYVCIFAFQYTQSIGILATLTLFVMGSISVAFPVQGGIGPWHFAIISTLLLLGIGESEAGAFALVVHGAQMVLIVILGIYTAFSVAYEKREK